MGTKFTVVGSNLVVAHEKIKMFALRLVFRRHFS